MMERLNELCYIKKVAGMHLVAAIFIVVVVVVTFNEQKEFPPLRGNLRVAAVSVNLVTYV